MAKKQNAKTKPAVKEETAKANPRKKAATKKATKKIAKISPVKGKSVSWYIGTLEEWQKEIVRELDSLIHASASDVTSSIKWAQPVYELCGPFAFIKAAKKHVTFGFWRGTELDDTKNLLEGDGAKMRHIKLQSISDVPKSVLKKWVKQAVKLNKDSGDPTKSKKSRILRPKGPNC